MISATATTYEIDDIPAAVEQLAEGIESSLELRSNSVGILFSQPDIDTPALLKGLNNRLGIDIIGGTTAGAATLSREGHHELAVTLHVLTADDCCFAAEMSDSLSDEPEAALERLYTRAAAKLPMGNPKVMFCVAAMMPNISSDGIVAKLSDASGNVPLFGLNAADDFDFVNQRVYLNSQVYDNRVAILLISGNVKPLFCIDNLLSDQTVTKRRVTKSRGNIIVEIDGRPAQEYLKEFPFIRDNLETLWSYQFFVEMRAKDDDGIAVSRVLHSVDKENGEITCFGDVPENSFISLMYCDGDDVKRSCRSALHQILSKISEAESESDYRYSTLIVTSCSLRIMYLADEKAAEGALLSGELTGRLAASGVYAYGEIAPTSVSEGKARNRFHNATITVCAL